MTTGPGQQQHDHHQVMTPVGGPGHPHQHHHAGPYHYTDPYQQVGFAYGYPGPAQLRHSVTPWHQRPFVRVLMIVLAVLICGVGFAILALLIGVHLGPGLLLVATLFAALPVPVLLMAFLWLDRFEPEPWHYLAFAFGWGAFVATVIALFINDLGAMYYEVDGRDDAGMKNVAVFVAPPAEEIAKAVPLFLMLALTWFGRRPINGVVDAMVYAGFSAVGFAFTENIIYFGSAYLEGKELVGNGVLSLLVTFVVRGILSPFAHPMFTVLTGIGVGLAVRNRHLAIRILAPIGGLLFAIGLHALWNLIASSGSWRTMGIGYLALMLPILGLLITLAIWIRTHEARATQRVLPGYVQAGWLSVEEVNSLATTRHRRAARDWANTYGGASSEKAMRELQLAATRLAMLREDVERGVPRRDYPETEQNLLTIISTRRDAIRQAMNNWQQRVWQQPAWHPTPYSY